MSNLQETVQIFGLPVADQEQLTGRLAQDFDPDVAGLMGERIYKAAKRDEVGNALLENQANELALGLASMHPDPSSQLAAASAYETEKSAVIDQANGVRMLKTTAPNTSYREETKLDWDTRQALYSMRDDKERQAAFIKEKTGADAKWDEGGRLLYFNKDIGRYAAANPLFTDMATATQAVYEDAPFILANAALAYATSGGAPALQALAGTSGVVSKVAKGVQATGEMAAANPWKAGVVVSGVASGAARTGVQEGTIAAEGGEITLGTLANAAVKNIAQDIALNGLFQGVVSVFKGVQNPWDGDQNVAVTEAFGRVRNYINSRIEKGDRFVDYAGKVALDGDSILKQNISDATNARYPQMLDGFSSVMPILKEAMAKPEANKVVAVKQTIANIIDNFTIQASSGQQKKEISVLADEMYDVLSQNILQREALEKRLGTLGITTQYNDEAQEVLRRIDLEQGSTLAADALDGVKSFLKSEEDRVGSIYKQADIGATDNIPNQPYIDGLKRLLNGETDKGAKLTTKVWDIDVPTSQEVTGIDQFGERYVVTPAKTTKLETPAYPFLKTPEQALAWKNNLTKEIDNEPEFINWDTLKQRKAANSDMLKAFKIGGGVDEQMAAQRLTADLGVFDFIEKNADELNKKLEGTHGGAFWNPDRLALVKQANGEWKKHMDMLVNPQSQDLVTTALKASDRASTRLDFTRTLFQRGNQQQIQLLKERLPPDTFRGLADTALENKFSISLPGLAHKKLMLPDGTLNKAHPDVDLMVSAYGEKYMLEYGQALKMADEVQKRSPQIATLMGRGTKEVDVLEKLAGAYGQDKTQAKVRVGQLFELLDASGAAGAKYKDALRRSIVTSIQGEASKTLTGKNVLPNNIDSVFDGVQAQKAIDSWGVDWLEKHLGKEETKLLQDVATVATNRRSVGTGSLAAGAMVFGETANVAGQIFNDPLVAISSTIPKLWVALAVMRKGAPYVAENAPKWVANSPMTNREAVRIGRTISAYAGGMGTALKLMDETDKSLEEMSDPEFFNKMQTQRSQQYRTGMNKALRNMEADLQKIKMRQAAGQVN